MTQSLSQCADPLLKVGSDRNRCPNPRCQAGYFRSSRAFELHRTGSFGELIEGSNPPRYTPSTRRCMTTAEMRAKGMAENKDGYWVSSLMDEEVLAKKLSAIQS